VSIGSKARPTPSRTAILCTSSLRRSAGIFAAMPHRSPYSNSRRGSFGVPKSLEHECRSEVSMSFHRVDGTIRYLTTAEGGLRNGVASGYSGQFYYQGDDWDAIQQFPDVNAGSMIELGTTVRVVLHFPLDRWKDAHSKRIYVGMPFEIREGSKTVGRGIVTRLDVDGITNG
jgi:hypothetical protein